MKKRLYSTLIILFVFINSSFLVFADNSNVTVHVTATGAKYHRKNCTYLSSDIEITLIEAIEKGYTPCSRCDPPTLYSDPEDTEKPYVAPKKKKNTSTYSKSSSISSTNAKASISNDYHKSDSSNEILYFFILLIAIFIIYWIIVFIRTIFDNIKKEKVELSNYKYYFSIYAFHDPIKFVDVPDNARIVDGLPVTDDTGAYGKYTVYVSAKGKCFHHNPKCANTLQVENYANAYYLKPCRRCVKCGIPELKWYWKYKEIAEIKKKYKIP